MQDAEADGVDPNAFQATPGAIALDGAGERAGGARLTALTLNLLAAVRTTRAALPIMLTAGRETIVTTSSVNAFLPDPSVIDYGAAKAAPTNFSKALSKEVGPKGIRVNTVSPGPVATDLWLGDDGVAATVARAHGSDPADVAKTVASCAQRTPANTGRPLSPAGARFERCAVGSDITDAVASHDATRRAYARPVSTLRTLHLRQALRRVTGHELPSCPAEVPRLLA